MTTEGHGEPGDRSNSRVQQLEEKIRSRTARVGIVGLGYVGLPLAVEFAKAGFTVTGIDVSEQKVARVNAGDSYVQDVPSGVLGAAGERAASCAPRPISRPIAELDTINICVPDAAAQDQRPGHELHRRRPARRSRKHFHPGMLVILESTTYPGHHRRAAAADAREVGPAGGPRFLPVLLAGARRPGQPEVPDREHPQGGGRRHAGLHATWARCSTRRRSSTWCR